MPWIQWSLLVRELNMAKTARNETNFPTRLQVWDVPVRLFHWLTVLAFAVLWYSGSVGGMDMDLPLPGGKSLYLSNMDVHMWLGQLVLTLVIFRILWGVVGSSTARFSSFLRGPRAVLDYVKAFVRGETPLTAGHNAGGGWMVVALLLLLAAQAITGLFANDDLFSEGPLAHLVSSETSGNLTQLHVLLFNVLLGAILLHILAVLSYVFRGKNLIGAMVTGRKPEALVPPEERAGLRMVSVWRALVLLAISILIVWSLHGL